MERLLAERYDELLASVVRRVSDLLGVEARDITPGAVLLDLGAQSIHILQLKLGLEREYHVTLPDWYGVPDLHTVDAFVWAVAGELAAR